MRLIGLHFLRTPLALLLLGAISAWTGLAEAQAVSVPHSASGIVLNTVGQSVDIDVDTQSLPIRPRIRAIATPDASHPDLTVEIEVLDCDQADFFFPPGCQTDPCECHDAYQWLSGQAPGEAEVLAELWLCLPIPSDDDPSRPDQCTVRITAIDFGVTNPPPATIDVLITGEERPATGSVSVEVDPTPPGPITVDLEAARDATIYEGTNQANGGGEFLRVGDSAASAGASPTEQRALISFELENGPGNPIPYGADVVSSSLTLNMQNASTEGSLVTLHRVDEFRDWGEGSGNPSGNEHTGQPATTGDVTWFERNLPINWVTAGGDFEATASVSESVAASSGPVSFAGAGLDADLQAVLDTIVSSRDTMNHGWVLRGPLGGTGAVPFVFDSREASNAANHPMLTVEYQENAVAADELAIERVQFINDVDNFRWIYDDDDDLVVETLVPFTQQVQGECAALSSLNDPFSPPFAYTFLGDSNFTGHDCCTWQSETRDSQGNVLSVGSGQAVIHVGVPISTPIPDDDGDGIGNPCDNCIAVPNGPDLGSCMPPGGQGDGLVQCLADADCSGGDICSLGQEDLLFDRVGDACPEPGTTAMLASGLLALVGLTRRRARA